MVLYKKIKAKRNRSLFDLGHAFACKVQKQEEERGWCIFGFCGELSK